MTGQELLDAMKRFESKNDSGRYDASVMAIHAMIPTRKPTKQEYQKALTFCLCPADVAGLATMRVPDLDAEIDAVTLTRGLMNVFGQAVRPKLKKKLQEV